MKHCRADKASFREYYVQYDSMNPRDYHLDICMYKVSLITVSEYTMVIDEVNA